MLHVVLPPLVTAYAIFVAMVVLARRRPVARPHGRRGHLGAVEVLRTAACGYVAFLAIVLVFHVWIAGQSGALASAISGGAFLSAVWLATVAAWSAVASRRRR